jgi:PAS domain S-box-containing protein
MSAVPGPLTSKTRIDKQAEEAIRKAYAQTELLLSSITSILIGVNENGFVTHWNAVAEKTFGIPASSVMNRPFSECKIQWELPLVLAGIRDCRAKGLPLRMDDIRFRRSNGQEGFLGMTLIPLRQDTEGHMECILFGADITERKKMEQLKNEFVSTVSHELRTPLSVIKEGVSQVLEGILGEINEEQKRFLTISLEGIDRLGRIVDDLLDLASVEAGRMELKREMVDVASLARGIALAFNYQAKEKGLEIVTHLPPAVVEAYADKDKLVQVFTNLISNAIKFTEKGRIEISVVDKAEAVKCSVSDTGKGIAQEDLPGVFSKFQQFGQTAGSAQKGTGLGLSICKGIIDLHRGQIWAESKLGEGTKLTFALPHYSAKELFKEHIAKSLREAIRQESSLSIIVFDLVNYEALKKKIGPQRIATFVYGLEGLIKQSLRRQADVTIKNTRAILVLLTGTRKDDALMVAGRIQQTFDDSLTRNGLRKHVKITCKVATFPDDGDTDEELLAKVGES